MERVRAGCSTGPFNYDQAEFSLLTGLDCSGEESLTQQQFADEADINTIVRRFGLTGQLPDDVPLPTYGDFTDVVDFQTAMNAVTRAREEFMMLPADVRYRFANDPQRLLEFVADARNEPEARRLGLLKEVEEVDRVGVPLAGGAVAAVPPTEVKP